MFDTINEWAKRATELVNRAYDELVLIGAVRAKDDKHHTDEEFVEGYQEKQNLKVTKQQSYRASKDPYKQLIGNIATNEKGLRHHMLDIRTYCNSYNNALQNFEKVLEDCRECQSCDAIINCQDRLNDNSTVGDIISEQLKELKEKKHQSWKEVKEDCKKYYEYWIEFQHCNNSIGQICYNVFYDLTCCAESCALCLECLQRIDNKQIYNDLLDSLEKVKVENQACVTELVDTVLNGVEANKAQLSGHNIGPNH